MTSARCGGGDRGSVLLLVLGLVVRRTLISAVDGAALAGAQAVDARVLYESGLPMAGPLSLDEDLARQRAKEYLLDEGVGEGYEQLDIEITTTATTVTVVVSARVRLPIVNTVTPGARQGVRVDASATARSAVVP
jgi:hypothetical protein